jgi:cytidylate kinase
MAVVTLNGQIGSGALEVGLKTAHILKADYVDRLIFAEAAKRIGATVQAVAEKEREVPRLRDRVARFMQNLLERSAMSGAGGEPYFGPGIEVILSRDYYTENPNEPITQGHELDDEKFIQVTTAVVKDLAKGGNVIIVGRGGNMILKDMPGVLHVGVVAPKDRRIRTIMQREHLEAKEASEFVDLHEAARVSYFNKFFGVHPDSPSCYHLMMNMADIKTDTVAQIVADAAKDMAA